MVQRLVHADWSVKPAGRWAAFAERNEKGWRARGPIAVPALPDFIDGLFGPAPSGRTLAGFDFPLGLPAAYGEKTGLGGFLEALDRFGNGDWDQIYKVAVTAGDVSMKRPFYPSGPGGRSKSHLLAGHGVGSIDALMRQCERAAPGWKAAECLFWTLGAKQVGKAALAGWRDLVVPARRRGARLWPFEDDLRDSAGRGDLVLAETYPAYAYGLIGVVFKPGESKLNQADRATKALVIDGWAKRAEVELDDGLSTALHDGFGSDRYGGDRFDAVAGLFGMIATLGRLPRGGAPATPAVETWEGWIFGRAPPGLTG